MVREVVHDADVGRPALEHQDLHDFGFESVAVDRPVQHHQRNHAGHGQARDQRGRLAVAVRIIDPLPHAFRAAPLIAGHARGCPGLVDKDETLGFEVDLPSNQCWRCLGRRDDPAQSRGRSFFACNRLTHDEAMYRANPYGGPRSISRA